MEPSQLEFFGNYKVLRVLSNTSQSHVVLAICNSDNQFYACKILSRDKLTKDDLILLEHETRIHQFLNHENIIKFKEVLYLPKFIILVTEYCCQGNLIDSLKEGLTTTSTLYTYCYQIFKAISYLHKKGYVHLDLKPDNIFLDENYNIKIGDFGCCIESHRFSPNNVVGTIYYMAPELIENTVFSIDENNDVFQSPYYIMSTPNLTNSLNWNIRNFMGNAKPFQSAKPINDPTKCDVWSIGIVIYALFSMSLPWENEINEGFLCNKGILSNDSSENQENSFESCYRKLIDEILHREIDFPEIIPKRIKELIIKLLNRDPSKRPSIQSIIDSGFFSLEQQRENILNGTYHGPITARVDVRTRRKSHNNSFETARKDMHITLGKVKYVKPILNTGKKMRNSLFERTKKKFL